MNDIILIALHQEAPELFKYKNVFEIGVGKVNAAINTVHLIHQHKPSRIINFGTAGGVTVSSGIHRVNQVCQHDFNLSALGLSPGEGMGNTPSLINILGDGIVCASGDFFVTEHEKLRMPCDLVDMEAYSIAKAGLSYNIPVEIWKYVSDKADAESAHSWENEVSSGQVYYQNIIKQLNIQLLT